MTLQTTWRLNISVGLPNDLEDKYFGRSSTATWRVNISVTGGLKSGLPPLNYAQTHEVLLLSGQEQELEGPTIRINLSKLEGNLSTKIEEEFKALEERLTPKQETTGLTEQLGPTGDVVKNFDWRAPIEEMLKDTSRNAGMITSDDYKLRKEGDESTSIRKLVEGIVVRDFSKDRRETTYDLKLNESLTEAIGTIAQGAANCAIPEIWSDKIERDHVYPGSVFLGAAFMNWYTEIQGRPGDKIWIPRVAPALCVDLTCDEPDTVAPVIACPYIELEHDVCAYAICKNDIETVQYGLVDAINDSLGSCLEVCVDNYFFNIALSCVNRGTLVHTGAMSGSLLLEAIGTMQAGTYDPVKVIMHPVPHVSLMQDTNFRYANQFGARDVVTGGRLETAYGVEINVTPKGTLLIGGGTYRTLLLAQGALAGALKHGITIETEYSPRLQKRWVLADIKYGGVCLHPDGIYWIQTFEG